MVMMIIKDFISPHTKRHQRSIYPFYSRVGHSRRSCRRSLLRRETKIHTVTHTNWRWQRSSSLFIAPSAGRKIEFPFRVYVSAGNRYTRPAYACHVNLSLTLGLGNIIHFAIVSNATDRSQKRVMAFDVCWCLSVCARGRKGGIVSVTSALAG